MNSVPFFPSFSPLIPVLFPRFSSVFSLKDQLFSLSESLNSTENLLSKFPFSVEIEQEKVNELLLNFCEEYENYYNNNKEQQSKLYLEIQSFLIVCNENIKKNIVTFSHHNPTTNSHYYESIPHNYPLFSCAYNAELFSQFSLKFSSISTIHQQLYSNFCVKNSIENLSADNNNQHLLFQYLFILTLYAFSNIQQNKYELFIQQFNQRNNQENNNNNNNNIDSNNLIEQSYIHEILSRIFCYNFLQSFLESENNTIHYYYLKVFVPLLLSSYIPVAVASACAPASTTSSSFLSPSISPVLCLIDLPYYSSHCYDIIVDCISHFNHQERTEFLSNISNWISQSSQNHNQNICIILNIFIQFGKNFPTQIIAPNTDSMIATIFSLYNNTNYFSVKIACIQILENYLKSYDDFHLYFTELMQILIRSYDCSSIEEMKIASFAFKLLQLCIEELDNGELEGNQQKQKQKQKLQLLLLIN